MKILIGHNYYQQAGGEDAVFHAQIDLFRNFGHEMVVYKRHNNEIDQNLALKISHAFSLRFSKRSYQEVKQLIYAHHPSVAHFHNLFFMMTPSVLYACKDQGIPTIISLHNFRLMCINALFYRDGHPCEDCVTGSDFSGIQHKCYHHSLISSVLVTDRNRYHWKKKTWENCVDRFLVATQFTKDKYTQAGINPDKISVVPPFVSQPNNSSTQPKKYAFYSGRLSHEKGISFLVKAWANIKFPLYIAGAGPEQIGIEKYIKEHQLNHIHMVGFLEKENYAQMLAGAKFLVVPSVCYENFPRVIAEAYSHGIPVLASRLGTMEQVVEEGNTGFLFTPENISSLIENVDKILSDERKYQELCRGAQNVYELKYTPQRHYQNLMEIYSKVTN
jgi:glycosyltransferase involved in cell wall biosynthesis